MRRGLYDNIVLSGGSTMFKDFGRRLQRDIKRISDHRLAVSEQLSGGKLRVSFKYINFNEKIFYLNFLFEIKFYYSLNQLMCKSFHIRCNVTQYGLVEVCLLQLCVIFI